MRLRARARPQAWVVLAASAFVWTLGAPGAHAEDAQGAPSRQVIEQIVREYILGHPEIIVESLRALEQRQREAHREKVRETIAARHDELLTDPASPLGGNLQGDVTVVEFFDYRCGYCKEMAGTVKQLLQDDPGIRLVYKELPILGGESVLAARAALASNGQGKYAAFHDALMEASGSLTREAVLKIAERVGLDTAQLGADMEKPEILAALQKNYALAQALGVNATPSFIVASELVPGAVDLARLKDLVTRARKGTAK
jgi:protein-disulfide isomerase